jgi:hypothetical protein
VNKFAHISKPVICAALVVAAVVWLAAAHRFGGPELASTDLEVPAQTWAATSRQPASKTVEATIEISDLPTLPASPTQDEWEISPLPKANALTFEPLPKMVSGIGADAAGDDGGFEFRSLPESAHQEPASIDDRPQLNDFEFPISNFEVGESRVKDGKDSADRDFEIRSLPLLGERKPQPVELREQSKDFGSEMSSFEIRDAEIGSFTSENSSPAPSQTVKPDLPDFASARRLRSLPMPMPEANSDPRTFAAVAASAELEITGPQVGPFSGVSVNAFPQQLADRIAAIEPQPKAKPEPKAQAKPKAKAKKKKKVVAAPKKGDKKPSKPASAKDDFKLAAQPKIGDHYIEDKPLTDDCAHLIEPLASDFSADALNPYLPYDPGTQMNVYQGKTLNANQRPLVECGRPWYQLGQLSPGSSVLGFHNNVTPQFLIFGDSRVAYASNNQNNNSDSLIATQLNLDFDLKLTGTERFHAFVSPTGGAQHNRYLLDEDRYVFEGDANIDFGYFEGDLGAIVGGAINKTMPFDLPFTVGIIPLVFQNGIWMEDAILGFAATLPAKNSPRFNISNMDITFFAGYDKLVSDAFPGDDSAARVMGIASFIEALNGYIEVDYAFLDDRTFDDRSYHNIGIGYTRRYGRFLSNSTRVIVNAGQSTDVVENTADGVLLLSENSLITGHPSNIVPYFNMFAGFDRPQSVARAGAAGGVLRNTGILFESDNLTGYPTLDATANDTFGFAAGINILSSEFSQQLVLETAMLGVMGDAGTRRAQGDQYGVGFRYQLPLSNSVIFRADGMMGFLRNDDDVSGIRMEIRKKF